MKRIVLAFVLSACALSASAQAIRWGLSVSIPEGNWIAYAAPDGWNHTFGFLGFALEGAYAYSQNDSVSIKLGYLMDYPLPYGARLGKNKQTAPDFTGTVKHSYGFFLFLQNRYRSDFGLMMSYGLGLEAMTRTKLVWEEGEPVDDRSYVKKRTEIGFVGGLSYVSPWAVFSGIQYAPSFLSLGGGRATIEYSHIAFLDLGFKLGY
jgi:hypothetical protein